MKIYVEAGCMTAKREHLRAGAIVEIDEKEDKKLLDLKLVVKYDAKTHGASNSKDATETKVTALEEDKSGLETKVTALEEDKSGLETKVTALEEDKSGLETKVTALFDGINALNENANAGEMKKAILGLKQKIKQ